MVKENISQKVRLKNINETKKFFPLRIRAKLIDE